MNKESLGKILMILLVVFVLVFSLVLVLQLTKSNPQTSTQGPQNGLLPTPTLARPYSRWATDSAVLKIEEDLQNLDEDLKNVDLKETKLLPPVLDMEVKF